MKNKKTLFLLLLVLLTANIIYADSASTSIQVIIRLPAINKDSAASISTSHPSSITPSFLSHKSPGIEVVDFSVCDTISLRMINTQTIERTISIKLTFISDNESVRNHTVTYSGITLKSLGKIRVIMKKDTWKNIKSCIVIAEIIENDEVITSAGANKKERGTEYSLSI
ncbi:MAG: hypothetical protein AB7T10_09365 [bacterium]